MLIPILLGLIVSLLLMGPRMTFDLIALCFYGYVLFWLGMFLLSIAY